MTTKFEEEEELKQLKLSLPKEQLFNGYPMYLHQGFWNPSVEATIALQNHFQAQETDIFLTSFRKAGTTWLKALLFSLCNRANPNFFTSNNNPLLNHNPHELVPHLESNIYAKSRSPDLSNIKPPRLFGTHLPFSSLPDSIKVSTCKIIYVCRNPLDLFISSWKFYMNFDERAKSMKVDDIMGIYFEMFCNGKFPFGPFEDHVLGYWKQSLEHHDKVLFIKYEDLKADPKSQLARLAKFMGCPISLHEEEQGVVDDIIELCSIQRLKEVEANKDKSTVFPYVLNKWFFRKGEVGDWVNYLTPDMAQRLKKIMEEKFAGSGLTF